MGGKGSGGFKGKNKLSDAEILQFATIHPDLSQSDISREMGTSQTRVSIALRGLNKIHAGTIRKRKVNYDAVIQYTLDNPTLTLNEIGSNYGIKASRVCYILKRCGVKRPSKAGLRRFAYSEVIRVATENPDMKQEDIGKLAGGVTQSQVSVILRAAGVSTGRGYNRDGTISAATIRHNLKRMRGQSAEQHKWNQILSDLGLGEHRATTLQHVSTSEDFTYAAGMRSCTRNPNDED